MIFPVTENLQKFVGKNYFVRKWIQYFKKTNLRYQRKKSIQTTENALSSFSTIKLMGKLKRCTKRLQYISKIKAQHINRIESKKKHQMCVIHTLYDLNWIESRYTIEWRINKLRTSNSIYVWTLGCFTDE